MHTCSRNSAFPIQCCHPPPSCSLGCQSAYDCWLCCSQRHWTELCRGFSRQIHTQKYTHLPDAVEAGGGQAGSWRKETNYTLCYTCPHTRTQVHMCTHTRMHLYTHTHTHTQAAQLGLNGVSLLTYFFTVTQRQTLGTLALNINSAIKLFAWCECLGLRGGSNLTVPPPIFPVLKRHKQKEAPFCRLEVLTASYSLKQPSCLFVCVRENNRMRVITRNKKICVITVTQAPLKLQNSQYECHHVWHFVSSHLYFYFMILLWQWEILFHRNCGQLTTSLFRLLSTKNNLDMPSPLPYLKQFLLEIENVG